LKTKNEFLKGVPVVPLFYPRASSDVYGTTVRLGDYEDESCDYNNQEP